MQYQLRCHHMLFCRFVQAQPTWTHWSFPFVGRWLLAKMKGCKAGSAWNENQGCIFAGGITMTHKTVTWLLCCVKRTQSYDMILCCVDCLYHHCSQGDLRMACQPTALPRMKICWTWHCGSVAASGQPGPPRTSSFNRCGLLLALLTY